MTTDGRKQKPAAGAPAKRQERDAKLAAALRANLRERKRQKSARKEGAAPRPPERAGR